MFPTEDLENSDILKYSHLVSPRLQGRIQKHWSQQVSWKLYYEMCAMILGFVAVTFNLDAFAQKA